MANWVEFPVVTEWRHANNWRKREVRYESKSELPVGDSRMMLQKKPLHWTHNFGRC